MALVVGSFVVAETASPPTQQSNKIYLNPFYKESMTANTNYTFNVTVNPPDGISAVTSAIISYNGQINGQTQLFQIWVNGKTCNTLNYSVATAFSTTGNVQFSFDCSNRINQSGTYNVTLRSSVNTGAMSGWLDLTYMTKPAGTAEVHGTEYVAGDPGTMFLLLKDSSGDIVENASCTVDIYYPNTANATHPEWINNGVMQYKEEGLYFYDFTAPAIVGLYMVSATCKYYATNVQYNPPGGQTGPTRTVTLGTYLGDPFVLNDYSDWVYQECDSTSGTPKACDASFEWTLQNESYNALAVQYLGENNGAVNINMSWWNWTSNAWVGLPNVMTYKATAAGGVPSGVDEYLSNSIPVNNYSINPITKKVRIRLYSSAGSTYKQFDNWLVLKATQSTNVVQDLKGSGEIHVSSSQVQGETSKYLNIETCDGFVDGRCAYFTNDNEFKLAEGELEDIVNTSAFATLNQQTLRYYSPFSVDCTALYWVKEWNGTGWVDFTDYTTYSQPAVENCEITITRDIVAGESYRYWFKFDNYMKWEVDWTNRFANTINQTVAQICDPLNYTWVNPIVENTTYSNNSLIAFCQDAKDDNYYINQYYQDSLGTTIVGDFASYVQEMRYYRPMLTARYTWLLNQGYIVPTLNTTNALAKQINITSLSINSTVYSDLVVDNQMNGSINALTGNVSIIKAQTTQINATTNATASLMSQVWTWVQSIFGWVQTDIDQNASTSITTNVVNTTVQTVSFVNAQYYQQQSSSVIAQVIKDGVSVTAATCQLNLYYPNMTLQVTNGVMSYLGVDGMYNYTWTPLTYGSHLARVNCSGGTLTQQVQASGSLGVSAPSTGVNMQVLG
jgi:hypothetical protein